MNNITIVIEGGVIQGIFADDPSLNVVVCNWDEEEAGQAPAARFPADSSIAMSEELRSATTEFLTATK
jgi:hypothetical protein